MRKLILFALEMTPSLESIHQIEDDWERFTALVDFAENKVKNFPTYASAIEKALVYTQRISLQASGGDWHGSIFYNPKSEEWKGFLLALDLLGHEEQKHKLIRANEIYWSQDREDFDWDDPLVSDVESFGPQGEEARELERLQSETWDFVAELFFEMTVLLSGRDHEFIPIPTEANKAE